ncbi:MAG: cation transporting ATPase C-terminal domain-containing protein, partial [Erysipelotrichaceae bacterium]
RNSISYLLSGNLSGILCVLFATLAALPKPFLPVHLLFINLVTDSLPAIAIGVEKPGKDLLRDKPRSIDEPILNKQTTLNIVVQGVLIGIVTMYAYFIGMRENPQMATTLAFSTLCLARLLHGFNCRGRASIFEIGFFSNVYSIYAFLLGFVFLNMILLIPALRDIFAVSAIGGPELLTIYFLAMVPTIIIQAWKVIRYR